MITYVRRPSVRVARFSSPEPPFDQATLVAPYHGPRFEGLAIDPVEGIGRAVDRAEVRVSTDAADLLERDEQRHVFRSPILVDACGAAEREFHQGEAAAAMLGAGGASVVLLLSADGELPAAAIAGTSVALLAWPPDVASIAEQARAARDRRLPFGLVVPVVFPLTTSLEFLRDVAAIARDHGAGWIFGLPIDLDAPAKKGVASLCGDGLDEDTYSQLFGGALETIMLATERHLSALAFEGGLADRLLVSTDPKSNWSIASMLSRAAARMVRLGEDTELAWTILRSSQTVAALDKPLTRVAEAASIGIVSALDDVSIGIVEEYLRDGRSSFVDELDARWRLRRDYIVEDTL